MGNSNSNGFFINVTTKEEFDAATVRVRIFSNSESFIDYLDDIDVPFKLRNKIGKFLNSKKTYPIWQLAEITYHDDVDERESRREEYLRSSIKAFIKKAKYGDNAASWEIPELDLPKYVFVTLDRTMERDQLEIYKKYGFKEFMKSGQEFLLIMKITR
jgi:hypothetical protein